MKTLLCCVLLLSGSGIAIAAPDLPLTCQSAAADGQLVNGPACGGTAQTGETYRTPGATDLVRVDPAQGSWNSPTYLWKLWPKVAAGELYEVCGDNVPEGTPVTSLCTQWHYIAKVVAPAPGSGTATLTWTPPTLNTDGSALTDLKEYRLYQAGSCAALSSSGTPAAIVPAPASTKVLTGFADGSTWCFGITSVNAAGTQSDLAIGPPKTFSAAPKVPTAPGGLAITVQQPTAFKMRQARDAFSMVAIGTVGLGTTCDAAHSVDGFSIVPTAAVKLSSRLDTMPLIAFARCG